jgi:hypothetical protein
VFRSSQEEIINELRKLGFDVDAVSDLFNKAWDYRRAIPVLLDWLPRTLDPGTKEALVRALSVKWARPQAGPPLIKEFIEAPPECQALKWAIGNALEVVADRSLVDQLVPLCCDNTHGEARQMIVLALGRMKTTTSTECLIRLLDDPEVQLHAIIALGTQRAAEALPKLEELARDSRSWIRAKAKGAIKRIIQTSS